jgi:peptidoglycan hydrolase-like protein with peptidoglycan-binding domain
MKKTTIILLAGLLLFPAISSAAINQNLSYGISSSAVTDLQNFLTTQGFYKGPITGNFFSLTRKAVVAYQSSLGIPDTGFVGALTRAAINNALSEASSSSGSVATVQTDTVPIQQNVSVTSVPSSTVSCNGINYPECPSGQALVCSTDGMQPYCQTPPPPATAAQLAGIVYLCTFANAQGSSTDSAIACNSGALLNGYNSNAIFRSNIDSIIKTLEQKEAAQQTQYNNAQAQAFQEYTNFLNTEQQGNSAQQIQNELQQLQNTLSQNNSLLNQQYWQKELQQEEQLNTLPKQTGCVWNAGLLDCNSTGY